MTKASDSVYPVTMNSTRPSPRSKRHKRKTNVDEEYNKCLHQLWLIDSKNLFRYVRVNFLTESVEQLARKIGVSKQSLLRNEQAIYSEPLPIVLEWFVKNTEYSRSAYEHSYFKFQQDMRRLNKNFFGDYNELDFFETIHPFITLRGSRSTTAVSKFLCIPQSTLDRFVNRAHEQQTVPRVLLDVMFEIGYTRGQLSNFELQYDRYRPRLLKTLRLEANGS